MKKTALYYLCFVVLMLFSCTSKKENTSVLHLPFTYEHEGVAMDSTTIYDVIDTFGIQALPKVKPRLQLQLQNASSLTDRLFSIALNDIELNIVKFEGKEYFGAGAHFGPMVYTRDIALSGVLGVNDLYPDIILQSLKLTRNLRRELGFTIAKNEDYFSEVINAPFQISELSGREFMDAYHTNSYVRRTDDVVWSKPEILPNDPKDNYTFKELVHYKSSKPVGSGSQLWTAAAFVNVCKRPNLMKSK